MTQPQQHTHSTAKLLDVRDLTLTVGAGGDAIVKSVSFDVAPGEMVGIVGESGSGKTQVARAILGLTPAPIQRAAGAILFAGQDLTQATPAQLRQLRGRHIGMVFQEPMTSLNPSMTIGRQLDEGLALHRKDLNADARRARVLDMLAQVGIRDPQAALTAWPHEFSGGMRQRMMLASVMLLEPALLVADEPTTALDAVVQRDVLELMVRLTQTRQTQPHTPNHANPRTAVLMISHDLAMVARYTERMIVMRHGEVVERGSTQTLLARPQHPYTQRLLAAMPRRGPTRTIADAPPVVSVQNLVIEYPGRRRLLRRTAPRRVLHGINLDIRAREVVAVVGGSGSGKTTLGRTIAGLLKPTQGAILFRGQAINPAQAGWWDYRLNCQMVFQDPYSSLNPRMTIAELVGEGLRHLPATSAQERTRRILDVLHEVGLDESHMQRFAHELSGGQRQRVAIARAVIRRPAFVIADEPVSALDVTVRAQVLELFADLQRKHGFSCLFISHDLSVVEQVADRVVVMQDGRIIEAASRDALFDHPREPYTRQLLSAIPTLATNETGGVHLRWRFDAPAAAAV